ncbi:MAG: flagellar hook-length control protein FliK [Bacteroidetes bacterium]|nr:flagellar hook-length control protein FliK [Bacteroidota bacterium]
MNSFPVLLLPAGEQLDVLGAGGRPPGADGTVVGGEAFLGLLQQMLLGSAVQMPLMAPAPIAGGGTSESGEAVTRGLHLSMEVTALLPDMASSAEHVSPPALGGTAQGFEFLGSAAGQSPESILPAGEAPTEQPAGIAIPAGELAVEEATPAPVPLAEGAQVPESDPGVPRAGEASGQDGELSTAAERPRTASGGTTPLPVMLTDTVEVADTTAGQVPSLPHGKGRGDTENKRVPADKASVNSLSAGLSHRAAGATVNVSDSPTIPVSSKEGDAPPTRVQESAPAAMEEQESNDPVQRMVNLLRHVATSTGADPAEHRGQAAPASTGKSVQVPAEFRTEDGQTVTLRESGNQTVKPVPAGDPSSQEGTLGDSAGHRNQFLHTPSAVGTPKADFSRAVEAQSRIPAMFAPLPPETAQSVMEQVTKVFALQVNGENSELRIKLEPESLGEVVLHVRMESGKMQAQIDVNQAGVKAALENNLPQLRLALHQRGIDVQRLDVSYGGERLATDSGGGNADRQPHHGFRRNAGADAVEQYTTGRLLGYNTMEMVM